MFEIHLVFVKNNRVGIIYDARMIWIMKTLF